MIARSIQRVLADRFHDLVAYALPQRCPACGEEAEASRILCADCWDAIPRLSISVCARCLAHAREPVGCLAHDGQRVWAAWVYDERAAILIHALKYGERFGVAARLGLELARVAPPAFRPELILEVPLHPTRRRERGYNQAALLADAMSEHIGAPRVADALERIRPTRPQARLGLDARRANVLDAFRVRRPSWVKGRNVLVVDDVMTTGATLGACLAALARAGACAQGIALAWSQ